MGLNHRSIRHAHWYTGILGVPPQTGIPLSCRGVSTLVKFSLDRDSTRYALQVLCSSAGHRASFPGSPNKEGHVPLPALKGLARRGYIELWCDAREAPVHQAELTPFGLDVGTKLGLL